MGKRFSIITLFILVAFLLPASIIQAKGNGVDDLRGRWDVNADFQDTSEGIPGELTWLIQDIEPHPELENVFLANGCMRTQESKKLAPLSLVATFHPEANSYDIRLYSTVIPGDWDPYVIRFDGGVQIYGSGVSDDEAEGTFTSDPGVGDWSAIHHDRRRPSCSGVENSGLEFNADVYAHMDLAPPIPRYEKIYEAFTRIVSSGMNVETPDGETIFVPPYNDIYTPGVDFINEFRFLVGFDGSPVSGEYYKFTLLDILGKPIPGAYAEDIWVGCQQGAPTGIQMEYTPEDSINMSWNPVEDAPGWDPDGEEQIGFYQIGIFPRFESSTSYGSNGIASSHHIIPWQPFEPGAPGVPDGSDLGVSLNELDDGDYEVSLASYAVAPPGSGGFGHECGVSNSSEFLQMVKQGSDLTFIYFGTISGNVSAEGGSPIAGAWVNACEYSDEPNYCFSQQTDENGNYRITGVLPGDYRVQAGGSGWMNVFYDGQTYYHEADPVNVQGGIDTTGINFVLEQGGTISGTVSDEFGIPIPNIAVDIEQGGYGTCTDENGNYILQGLPLGTYTVNAGRDFCEPHNYVETRIDGVVLTSVSPDVSNVNFNLLLGGSIEGVITDAYGNPLEGATVTACEYTEGEFCKEAWTAPDGSYQNVGLPAGTYRVWAHAESWADKFYDDTFIWSEATSVDVSPGSVSGGIDISLADIGSISGTVYDDATDLPLEGICVDVGMRGYAVQTDENGGYLLFNIPLGTHDVIAGFSDCGISGYAESVVPSVELTVDNRDQTGVDFSLSPP